MDQHKDVEVQRTEKKTDTSKVGVAFIKYATYLIIFFAIMWFVINYIL
ncbi:hypothetical protein SAMN04488134_102157 [Amphibacillus marinus]|uniref:Uncharacterized protein n=1 Tax=Amphibacillus marinus TaxID=872970 RepID=A0A1H8K307_9BACI|nr:hypothetical protein [Amphibacillus marinus]SEN87332.1 hypothetical protein SAMN04488134_102157 [Amphibacillus marinus]